MSKDRSRIGALSGARFEARCAWCGPVRFGREDLTFHVSQTQALFEFDCPACGRLNIGPLGQADAAALLVAGVRRSQGPSPFELLESRAGPPIGWDDIIDFHEALTGSERQRSLTKVERDAA